MTIRGGELFLDMGSRESRYRATYRDGLPVSTDSHYLAWTGKLEMRVPKSRFRNMGDQGPDAQITVPAELPFISFDWPAWHCRQNCDVELAWELVLFGL